MKSAVIVETTGSGQSGIQAEHFWLARTYPGYKLLSQTLVQKDDQSYDLLEIQTFDGQRKERYFDISNFFAKP